MPKLKHRKKVLTEMIRVRTATKMFIDRICAIEKISRAELIQRWADRERKRSLK